MLGTTETLLVYYLGLGFVVLLGWAACQPDHHLEEPQARRYLRRATLAAILGVIHPAVPLAARDIVGQVGIDLPDTNPDLRRQHARATACANVLAIVSAIPALALLALAVM